MKTRSHSGAQRAATTTGAVVSPLARATLLAVILSFIPLIGLSQTRISGSQLRLTTRLVTSTSDTITQADCGRLVSYRNADAMNVTLPDAASLPVGCWMDLQNAGPGTIAVGGQSTIDGQASISLTVNQGVRLVSTGVTYLSQRGQGQGSSATGAIGYDAGPSGALAVDNLNHTVDIASGVVCLVSLACSPTNVFDLSGATVSKPAKNAAGDPANCSVSEKYFNITTGKFRNCLTPNTWTDENSGGAQISAGGNIVNTLGVLSWAPFDPTTAWGKDEFCGGDNYAVGINQYGELGWQAHSDNTGAIVTYINGTANHPCIIHLSTDGSTAYGNEMLALISASAVKQLSPLNAGSYEFNFVFRMNQTGTSDLYVGLDRKSVV